MDSRVMELRIQKWIPIIEAQAKSGMGKNEWCAVHGINRTSFFRWQKRVREYLLNKCASQASQLLPPATSSETSFVEISCTRTSPVGVAGQADRCDGAITACSVLPPSISIRYGDFSIDLGSDVDEKQLSTVLRVLKHAD